MCQDVFLSIIIPVYNTEKYIGECIDSLLRIIRQNHEIIIINDGSTDHSGEICDRYSENSPQITVIHKCNEGASTARNVGIKHAKGRYIMFVDSDDIIDDQFVCAVNEAANNDYDVILEPAMYYCDSNGKLSTDYVYDFMTFNNVTGREAIKQLIDTGHPLWSACSKFFRKDFLIENELYFQEGSKTEDFDLVYRVIFLANKVRMFSRPFYIYRACREDSVTHSIDYAYMDSLINSISKMIAFYNENKLGNELLAKMIYRYRSMIMQYVLFNIRNIEKSRQKEIYNRIRDNLLYLFKYSVTYYIIKRGYSKCGVIYFCFLRCYLDLIIFLKRRAKRIVTAINRGSSK